MTMKAKQMLVMYASQTGNAEWIAKSIDAEAIKKGYKSRCLVMDQFEEANLDQESVVVLVSSTTGDGDSPDNALKWWRYYRKLSKAQPQAFAHMKIAVLGIGDTNYSNFGAHPKKLDKKFQDLGATTFYPLLIADEVEGLEAQIDPWIAGFWEPLAQLVEQNDSSVAGVEHVVVQQTAQLQVTDQDAVDFAFKIPLNFEVPTEVTGVPKLPAQRSVLSIDGVESFRNPWVGQEARQEYTQKHPFTARVTKARCLTSEGSVKRTIELQVDLSGMNWQYKAGDAVGVLAPNNDRLVKGLLSVLGLKAEDKVLVKPINETTEALQQVPSHLPYQVAAQDLFRYHVDLTGFPRKAFFRCLAEYAQDLEQKKQLLFLSCRSGAETLKKLMVLKPTVLDILVTFPSVKLPLNALVDNLLPLQPRYYSACSSKYNVMHVAFNIVDYKVQDAHRLGVASVYLDDLVSNITSKEWTNINQQVPVFPRPSKDFVVPTQGPVVMIAAGTGVTPFIGFLQELAHSQRECWLFYGCRSVDKDFLFKPEIMGFLQDGTLSKCNVAVSREAPPLHDKVKFTQKYVQDAVKEEGHELINWMLHKQASIFVCGDANDFAHQVQQQVVELLQVHAAQDQAESMLTFADWLRTKRYVRDVWS